ncbi:MAG TPA: hypothetical protein VJ932_10180 [Alkalispirochaeta sp.]|nr:hypothetical protein [Alkalispirochaeta sp.]
MDYDMLTDILFWCSLINIVVLFVASVMVKVAGVWFYETREKWFAIPEDKFLVVTYAVLGGYKVLIIFFNVVPWAVLSAIG